MFQFQTKLEALPDALKTKLLRIGESLFAQVEPPELDLGAGLTVRGTVRPGEYQINRTNEAQFVIVSFHVNEGDATANPSITDATARLIDNVWSSIEQMAWNHFRRRLDVPTPETSPRRKVFLSYRKRPGGELTAFVTTIADRVGREGFLPWLDAWEIRAGDSLPREIAAGLEDAYAIIIVLTPDYPEGRWAREEMEVAITKRVERNLKVIPVLYEDCARPTLLEPLVYVDATSHEPDKFETQFREIIDALNVVDLNPYRR